MEIKLTLLNKDELISAFKKAPAVAAREYDTGLAKIAMFVQRKATENAPVGKGEGGGARGAGGNLRQSIRARRLTSMSHAVTVNADYGVYVDQGTRPHVILPRRKSFLAFKINGQWVRTKRVNHPGTKPTFFFTNAVKDAESYGNDVMKEAMNNVLNSIK